MRERLLLHHVAFVGMMVSLVAGYSTMLALALALALSRSGVLAVSACTDRRTFWLPFRYVVPYGSFQGMNMASKHGVFGLEYLECVARFEYLLVCELRGEV